MEILWKELGMGMGNTSGKMEKLSKVSLKMDLKSHKSRIL